MHYGKFKERITLLMYILIGPNDRHIAIVTSLLLPPAIACRKSLCECESCFQTLSKGTCSCTSSEELVQIGERDSEDSSFRKEVSRPFGSALAFFRLPCTKALNMSAAITWEYLCL